MIKVYSDRTTREVPLTARRNDTDETFPFFCAIWGPHGCIRPGNWSLTDRFGFSVEVTPEEFEKHCSPVTVAEKLMGYVDHLE